MHALTLISVVALAWVLQYGLTLLQIRHYRFAMRQLLNDYRNQDGFYLFSGIARKAVGSGAIVLMIVDDEFVIHRCQVLTGISVFAKFRSFSETEGMHAADILAEAEKTLKQKRRLASKRQSLARAMRMAAENAIRSIGEKRHNAPLGLH
ncbi:MAG: transcriptional regulator GutM [Bacilli bacterium]